MCVYTAGSPINNRALFPCQEPPVAMSTWQATVRAPSECVVLMSGEEQAAPIEDGDTRKLLFHKPFVTARRCQAQNHKCGSKGFHLVQHIQVCVCIYLAA